MRNKLIAYCIGILCHIAFIMAIASMAYMLANGLTSSILPIGGLYGRYINLILLIQFPMLHSFFLTPIGRKILILPFPKEIGKDLITTTYALIASLQLLVVFVFWTPNQNVWYLPSRILLIPWITTYFISWVILIKALSEAGMAMHSGSLGWRSIVTGRKVVYPRIPTSGLHNQCRHPIYLAFSLIILTAPVWSFDHFLFTTVWGLYCLIGPKFKEHRIKKKSGEEYKVIQKNTPYFIPRSLYLFSRFKQTRKS